MYMYYISLKNKNTMNYLFAWSLCSIVALVYSQEKTTESQQLCAIDADCLENSFCFGNDEAKKGKCKCLSNYILWTNFTSYACVLPADGIGSACVVDEQCELTLGLHSQCGIKNQCECLPTAHFIAEGNSCYSTSGFNETCVDNNNCYLESGDTLYCTHGKCTCNLNEHFLNGKCIMTHHIGEQCTTDENCIPMNAVCREVCVCRTGYVVANDEQVCLKAATQLGDSCTQLSQCSFIISDSVCVDQKCTCNSGYHSYGNLCYKTRKPGEPCKVKNECVTDPKLEGSIDCSGGFCQCVAGTDPEKECARLNDGNKMAHFATLITVIVLFLII